MRSFSDSQRVFKKRFVDRLAIPKRERKPTPEVVVLVNKSKRKEVFDMTDLHKDPTKPEGAKGSPEVQRSGSAPAPKKSGAKKPAPKKK